jgi:hypothetical protein
MGIDNSVPTGKLIAASEQTIATTKQAIVYGVKLHSGTAAGSVLLKTGGSSGTTLFKLTTIATTAAGDGADTMEFSKGLHFPEGLYVTLAGTSATVSVNYAEY